MRFDSKQIGTIVKAILSVSLIAYLFTSVGIADMADRLRMFSFGIAAMILLLLCLYHFIAAIRWKIILRALGCRVSTVEVTRITFVAAFFNQFLPTSVASDALRIFELSRAGHGVGLSTNSVILERGVSLMTLTLFSAIGLTFWPGELPQGARGISWLLFVSMAGLFLAILFMDRIFTGRFRTVRVYVAISQFSADMRKTLYRVECVAPILGTAFVNQAILAYVVFIIAKGLGIPLSAFDCAMLLPVVTLVTALPISLAGWGVREMAMVTTFGYAAVPSSDALLVSIGLALFSLLAALPGGPMWLISAKAAAASE
jgi:uncharacterized protein (TIRG00374 family)